MDVPHHSPSDPPAPVEGDEGADHGRAAADPNAAEQFDSLASPSNRRSGDGIGSYRLVSKLGEGGFGEVWLAERREPFVQRVALKLVKPGMDSRAVLARFEQERQALALMGHPNIAKVLDGGMTAEGRPFFAMEFVKGEPIVAFCDARRLSIKARLELFTQACEAVQHAHLKGVVHRDIKPSNILAFELDGGGYSLKVIDFGVAKAMIQPLTGRTLFTETGQMIGTPEYMSPEQADGSAGGIDMRSDVYSLGVVLYELVTGATPFDSQTLRQKGYGEVQRIIREEDPPSPSARLSTIATKDTVLAERIQRARGIQIRELARELRNELEWIPLKAMRKELHERYESVRDLRRDIDNYLAGRPLSAAPESSLYRLRKFARRNRVLLRTLAFVAVALGCGILARPAADTYRSWREARRMAGFTVLAREPDAETVRDESARERIKAIGKPWKIRHDASGIVLLLVPAGEFIMGMPGNGAAPHAIGKAFYLSQNEVSRAEWRAVVGRDAGFFKGANLPVDSVSWEEIQRDFLDSSHGFFRLPTDAEWEYACRAGTTTSFAFGDTVTRAEVCFGDTKPVDCGSLPANRWGFHEMHGNVFEWVADLLGGGASPEGRGSPALTDPNGARLLRGGAWGSEAALTASYIRGACAPNRSNNQTGFRVARDP